jgi:hypothetical protein
MSLTREADLRAAVARLCLGQKENLVTICRAVNQVVERRHDESC